MVNKSIRCSVNNCHYWSGDNYCGAEQIMVSSDRVGDTAPHTFNAMQASEFPHTPVASCMETCCKTFVTQGKDSKSDGIRKME